MSAVGNRTAYNLTTPLDGTAVTTYTYDAANRLLVAGAPGHSVAYTWDARGNLLSDGTFTYTYNAAGRMVQAQNRTATLVYTYNADSLRVAQSQSVSSVQSVDTFTWDWATGVPELLSDDESLYLIGYDTLGWQNGADWTFVLPDALGSVRQETDATGAVTAAREWSPYGEEVGGAQTGLGFTGEWWDVAVGLQYLRARWYDGTVGRFTQVDPIRAEHLYAYVVNNPVNLIDPTGYFSEEIIKNSLGGEGAGLFADWGGLEFYSYFEYRPKFSGLLLLLKRARSGDQVRNGRLAWDIFQGMSIKWEEPWFLGTTGCPERIVLSRDAIFTTDDKDLGAYIDELGIQRNLWYLYLGGGYVYHEFTFDGHKEIYRDGATSLVPDLLTFDINATEPFPVVDFGSIGVRVSIDRFGYLYFSGKLSLKGTGIGQEFPVGLSFNAPSGAVYYGNYKTLGHLAKSSRPTVTPDYIETTWGKASSVSTGDAPYWQFTPYFGAQYGSYYTMFTRNTFKPLAFGTTVGYKTTWQVGQWAIPWDNIDRDVIGVSWEEAVNARADTGL